MIKAIDQTQIPTWLGGTLDEGADPVQLNKLRMDPVISKTNKQTRRTKRRSVESKSNKARTANQRAIMSESGCISKTRVGSQSEFLIRGQHAEQNSAQRLVITSCYRPWTSTVSVAYRVLLSAFNWWIRFRGGGGGRGHPFSFADRRSRQCSCWFDSLFKGLFLRLLQQIKALSHSHRRVRPSCHQVSRLINCPTKTNTTLPVFLFWKSIILSYSSIL